MFEMVRITYGARLNAWLHAAFTRGTFAAPVRGFRPSDSARVVPRLSTSLGQFGSVETNRLAARVTDTWSVSTHAPGGIRRSTAAGIGPMTRAAALSNRSWATATTASATADTAAIATPSRWAAFGPDVCGQETARPSCLAPTSSRDTGSAMVSAMNGARNWAKW